ncbi:MAG TPA: DUF433 domain-containing protein [Ktedonobacterales bacterium]|nr:DUF433 domain-containing protein [Ktedonobacterales bacterium]
MANTSTTPGIVTDPDLLGGKPTIEGTRIGVDLILEKVSEGESIEDILRDFPHLRREQIVRAIQYAAKLVRTATA